MDFSKRMTRLVILLGFVIAQECLALSAFAIWRGFSGTAAYLTAAVSLSEAVIGAAFSFYASVVKVDHKEGGITFETAKANGFQRMDGQEQESTTQSPPI